MKTDMAPPIPSGRLASLARRFRSASEGASAAEFALILPTLLTIYLGGYETVQAVGAYRKVTLTTRTVADLTTQYSSMAASDVSTVLNASAQVMAPYPTTSLSIVLTEFQVSVAGVATVTWSQALNGTPLKVGAIVLLPANICQPNASVVLSNVSYSFTPAVAYKLTGPIVMTGQLYMSPRQVQSIPYTG